jgi:type IX secretion system PorP/SprF family membrane protein
MGGQFGFGMQSINFSKLVFGDQITSQGLTGLQSQEGLTGTQNKMYIDGSIGGLLYSPSFQLGIALNHLNQPDISFLNSRAIIPIKFSAHVSWLIPILNSPDKKKAPVQYVKPFLLYRRQGTYDQFDAGANAFYDPLVVGLWYRGLLIKQEGTTWNNQDALCIYIGLATEKWEFGLSYDATVSRLGTATTAGSYELSLKYLFGNPSKLRINGFTTSGNRGINCPSWGGPNKRRTKRYNGRLR